MDAPDRSRQTFRFADFAFDPRSGELRKDGVLIRLQEQPFQILLLLLARPGDVVTRDEVRQSLWPGDTFVDFDVGLNSAVKRLRDALGDSAEKPRFVETLPRRGYRFIAPVEARPATAAEKSQEPVSSAAGIRSGLSRATTPVAVIAALLVGLALSGKGDPPRGPSAPAQIRSIAVIPFENLTGDREQDYFVDGMTDAVITNLAQVRALRVISRTSVMQYKRANKSLPRIAEELAVDAVVEGTVARSGDRVRITAQLIHAAIDRHLWARSYERDLRDVLVLQGEVAGAIAQAIQVKLRPEEQRRLARTTPVDPDAYEAYLKGRFYWSKRSHEATPKAIAYFQQAIARDATYAPAYSGLADSYSLFGIQGVAPHECMPKAEAAARKALALDDTLAEAHASLAGILYRYHWDWAGAEREFQLSLELDPNYSEGHRAYAIYLLTVRRNEEALAEAQRARELSPLSTVINVELGAALVRVGRYDEAIQRLQKTLEIDPGFSRIHVTLGAAYLGQGDWPRAVVAFEQVASLSPRRAHPWLGYAYAVSGRRRDALDVLARIETLSRESYISPQSFAVVHLGLGNKDQAFAWLDKAYEERAFDVLSFSGQLYDLLHDDPRFQDLLRRMRHPAAMNRSRTEAAPPPAAVEQTGR